MITPAYSPTATERVLPRMALDFTTGVLDSRVTITRALNTATRVNSSGFVEIVNANLPRFDYDPATLAAKGLLIEEARTNIALYSEQFNNALWVKSNSSVTPNAATSPDSTVNADLLVPTVALAQHRLDYTSTSTAATHAFSVYAKAAGYGFVWLRIGTSGGVVSLTDGSVSNVNAGYTVTATNAGGGWWRVAVVGTAALNSIVRINVLPTSSVADFAGDGTSGVFLYGAQLETGAFATSYIPTTTTSLTRNADVVSMTGTNFSSWFNASEGAVFVQIFRGDATGSSRGAWRIDSGATNNGMDYRPYGSNNTVSISGASQVDIYPGGGVANSVVRNVFGYKVNNFAASTNGGAVVTDTLGNLPTVNQMVIGGLSSATGQILCGHVQKVSYWPQRLTDAEIRAFSK